MASFILIHGAWHWGGCFGKVANILASQGHVVITPDMAGHGFDETPLVGITDMATYSAAARTALETVKGKAIVLGHSVGGATCTWLGEEMPEKIKALVYLTGFMAPNGKCPRDYVMTPAYLKDPAIVETQGLLRMGKEGLGIDLSKPELAIRSLYSDCTPHDAKIGLANLARATSHTPFVTTSKITPARFGKLPRHYVECLEDRALPLAVQRQMQADVPGAKVHSLATGHSPFFSAPDRVAEILLGLA